MFKIACTQKHSDFGYDIVLHDKYANTYDHAVTSWLIYYTVIYYFIISF